MENQPVFLIWSMSRFDELYSSAIFSLAKELANTHQVIYVDYPFTWKDRFSAAQKNRIEARNKLLQENEKRLIHMPELGKHFYTFLPKYVLPINWLPKGKLYQFFSQINNRLFLKAQKNTIEQLNIKKLILINSFSPLYGLSFAQYFSPEKTIYQCRDWIDGAPYIAKHGTEMEKQWIRKADLCLGTSSKITAYLKAENKNSYLLANAANYALFSKEIKQEPPAELAKVKGEKLLYVGNIGARLDWPLIEKFVKEAKDLNFIFVGPVTVSNPICKKLDRLENVHFWSAKKLEALPAYIHHSDYLWIPFLLNDLTSAIYPLKLQEYFSSGKPVFCSKFSADLNAFEKGIYFINKATKVTTLLEKANSENPAIAEKRIEWAKENTWKNRKKQLLKLLEI